MEKLAKLGWQKLIIIAAALDIVLGIIFEIGRAHV